jgi:hypothetical protein
MIFLNLKLFLSFFYHGQQVKDSYSRKQGWGSGKPAKRGGIAAKMAIL